MLLIIKHFNGSGNTSSPNFKQVAKLLLECANRAELSGMPCSRPVLTMAILDVKMLAVSLFTVCVKF